MNSSQLLTAELCRPELGWVKGWGEWGQHVRSIFRQDILKSELPKDSNEFPIPGGGQVKAG